MALQLSITNLTFPALREQELVAIAAAAGFAGVDFLDLWDGTGPLSRITYLDAGRRRRAADEIRRTYEAHGVVLSDVYALFLEEVEGSPVPALNAIEAADRETARAWFEGVLEFAREAGARGISIPTAVPPPLADNDAFERLVEEVAWRVERGREANLSVSIEPTMNSIVFSPTKTEELLNRIPDLQLTVDQSHFTYHGFVESDCAVLYARARHLHCRGAAKDHLQQPLSASTINYTYIVEALAKVDYEGFLCCEAFSATGFFTFLDAVDIWHETIGLRNLLRDEIAAAERSGDLTAGGVSASSPDDRPTLKPVRRLPRNTEYEQLQ
jgi:sugar phosphate isomerase/epimerase